MVSSVIAQLRTTDLAESIRFYTTKVGLTLEFQYQDFYRYHMTLTIKQGMLIPTAGIDESNGDGYYILWPRDP